MDAILERIVILGAAGQLGTDLMRAFADTSAVGLNHSQLDIEEPSSVLQAIGRIRPTLIVNTAAYHNVDLCESFPQRAFAVNALAVDMLAASCACAGIPFAHVSTDYVFDGAAQMPYTETDTARPLNVYGMSKRAGEQLMGRHATEQFIFRTSGLFGTAQSTVKGPNFVERMIRAAEERKPLKVVDDITFSPSFTAHVAQTVRRIVVSEKWGLYHVSNAGQCSWYDLAAKAIEEAGLHTDLQRVASPEKQVPRRPRMSALRSTAIPAAGVAPLPRWEDAVRDYVAERRALAVK